MSVLMVIALIIIGAAAWGVLIFGIMALYWSRKTRRELDKPIGTVEYFGRRIEADDAPILPPPPPLPAPRTQMGARRDRRN